ncbi:MAG: asparagine synthase (glutamine-hydrolyzing) [Crocinitomicaceae bacterium]
MCGILGIWAKNNTGLSQFEKMDEALTVMHHRGPDNKESKTYTNVGLGHVRLSIIDTAPTANQPFTDSSGRYTLIFNGEIYNYKSLKEDLSDDEIDWRTESDTEVLLYSLIKFGDKIIPKLNGFFAFVLYDNDTNEMLFARDAMGIKPLSLYEDGDKIILTSELNTLFKFDIDKSISADAINHYLGLTYVPAPHTLLERAYKIKPGRFGYIKEGQVSIQCYFDIQRNPYVKLTYVDSKTELQSLLEQAVEKRMVADVDLGAFLSGGVDSSVICSLAKKYDNNLKTFSIGFDHKYFDESGYAKKVADHISSDHHEIILGKKDFEQEFDNFLNAIDEPFADSSAFATYLLAKETKKHVTVALSGDGADELFGGYNKHRALLRSELVSNRERTLIKGANMLLGAAAKNRFTKFGEISRKVQKMNSGLKLPIEKRYWHWCHFTSIDAVVNILKSEHYREIQWEGYMIQDVSDSLIADQQNVLPNDMLKKVDLMSMANSLEVRTPFLDRSVVGFANSLPLEFKLDKKESKRILKETFQDQLPPEILYRPKRGFEIPLQEWLGPQIADIFNSDLFSKEFIAEQGIFKMDGITDLVREVNSRRFGDNIYLVWSLIIFQHWWKKNMIECEK